jgi:hypothetical protein
MKPADKQPNRRQPATQQQLDEYLQYLQEETDRFNALGELARQRGIGVPTGSGVPPLNPDGSLKRQHGGQSAPGGAQRRKHPRKNRRR